MEILALFCDAAETDENGKLNIRGIFNELQASDFPARQDRMVLLVVIHWDRSVSGRVPFRFDLVGPDAEPTCSVEGHTDVAAPGGSGSPARTEIIMPLENVLFVQPGRYRLKMSFSETIYEGPSLYLNRS